MPAPDHQTPTPTSSGHGVILVPSALFHTQVTPIPPGVRARDTVGFVEGLVEENSPLPIDQTAWGFLLDSQSKRASHILHYAAAAELALPTNKDPQSTQSRAILPGFAALHGLSISRDTWLFLLEDECLSAIYFKEGSTIPSQVISRFHEKPNITEEDIYTIRHKLEQSFCTTENSDILPGLVRAHSTTPSKSRALHFTLDHQPHQGGEWSPWKKTSLKKRTRLLAADIRDHALLGADAQRRKSTLTLSISLGTLAATLLLLITLEIILNRQNTLATTLAAQAAEQEKTVKRLQDMETMAASIQASFDKQFLPFDWIMAANAPRPGSISFTSLSLEDNGAFTINARASEVKAANDYTRNLRNTAKFTETTLSQIQSGRDGVTFNLRLQTGDLHAQAIGPTEPEEEPEPPQPEPEDDSETTTETPPATETDSTPA